MHAERELVIALSRTPLSDSALIRARGLVTGSFRWDFFFAIASSYEVDPVVMSNLLRMEPRTLPATAVELAEALERESRSFALARTLVLADLVGKLDKAGLPVLVLKGAALGVVAYDDPSMRTFQDIDLLVKPGDQPRARDLLLGLGYERDYDLAAEPALVEGGHALELSTQSSKVELHASLLERHLMFHIDEVGLWTEAVTIDCAGSQLRVLDSSTLLLFLCAHGAKHEWSRFRWICDVAQLVDRLDEGEMEKVVAMAGRAHAKRLLSLGLRLARDVFGQNIPESLVSALAPESDTRSAVQRVRTRLGLGTGDLPVAARWAERAGEGIGPLLFWAQSRERWQDRVACVMRVMFVPTGKDLGSGVVRWIGRPIRLVSRALRGVLAR